MNTIAIRQHVITDASHMIHLTIPPEMGNEVEVIVIPITELTSEEESFNLAACATVLEDDEQEDAIWRKYVRD